MNANYHLISNEQSSLKVSGYVHDYSAKNLDRQLDKCPLPSDVEQVVSDLITDLAHFASLNGVAASDVLSKAFQNFLEEISSGDAPKGTVDGFRTLIDEAVYEVTIRQVAM